MNFGEVIALLLVRRRKTRPVLFDRDDSPRDRDRDRDRASDDDRDRQQQHLLVNFSPTFETLRDKQVLVYHHSIKIILLAAHF